MCPLMCPGCCGRNSSQIMIACSISPAFRNSLARGAKYRRGFSSNFFLSSSMRAVLAIKASVAARRQGCDEADQDTVHEVQVNQKCHGHLILALLARYLFLLLPLPFSSCSKESCSCSKQCGAPPSSCSGSSRSRSLADSCSSRPPACSAE